jgi:dienelactone hydrolase
MTADDVSIPAPGGALPGYLSAPGGAEAWPGVVVLHDLVALHRRDARDAGPTLLQRDPERGALSTDRQVQ